MRLIFVCRDCVVSVYMIFFPPQCIRCALCSVHINWNGNEFGNLKRIESKIMEFIFSKSLKIYILAFPHFRFVNSFVNFACRSSFNLSFVKFLESLSLLWVIIISRYISVSFYFHLHSQSFTHKKTSL